MRRASIGLVAVALTWTTGVSAQQQPAQFPTGRYTMTMRDTTNELNRATFEITKDNHYFITHKGHVLFMGTYSVDGNRITFLGQGDTPCLDPDGNAIPGLYTWFVKGEVLTFTRMDDMCNERRLSAMIALFYPEGKAP
ncbi:MAG: hypothetical protein V3T16_07335 [Gemmatimonadales bacterium]